MIDVFVSGVIDDVRQLSSDSFVDTCTIYPYLASVSNGQGGYTTGYASGTVTPCRLDTEANRLLPSKSKSGVDVLKIQRNIYIPWNTQFTFFDNGILINRTVAVDDKVDTNAGNPTGLRVSYRVIDVTLETDQVDIGLLVEVLY